MKKLILFLMLMSFVGCSALQRREKPPTQQALPIPTTGELPPAIELPSQGEGTEAPPIPNVKVPKIGIVFGPAGARAYSYIGVLREFEKARLPIDMVAGVEWGSLMAALYSMNGKVNDVEWQSMKIPSDFVERSFLSNKVEPRSFSDMTKYLRTMFGGRRIENGRIPFACVTDNIRNNRSLMIFKGTYRDTLGMCMNFPPFLASSGGWVSAAFQIKYLIDQMAQRGVDYIILFDALTPANPIAGAKVGEETSLIWSQLTKTVNQNKIYVHQVIEIPIQKSILDFSSRREFIQDGEKAGQAAVAIILQKFGL